MFSHIFRSFSKKWIIHQLKQIFFKIIIIFFLRSVFISIYGFSQGFWLFLITLGTFFKTDSLFNACFKFLMWIPYSVLSCKLATSLLDFSIFNLQVKMVNHCERQHQTLTKMSIIAFFIMISYEIFIKLRSVFHPLKIIYRKLLQHCQSIWIIYFTSQYWIYDDYLFSS